MKRIVQFVTKVCGGCGYKKLSRRIITLLEQIMATQREHAEQLRQLGTQIDKVGTEVNGLKEAVTSLETALENQETTPEVDAAFAEVKQKLQAVDDAVPDAPVPEEPEEPPVP